MILSLYLLDAGSIFASRFEIASALFENACVAYQSALEFHGIGDQMFSVVDLFSGVGGLTFGFYYNIVWVLFWMKRISGA